MTAHSVSSLADEPDREWCVLGIDPGTASTGYGVVIETGSGDYQLLACGVIRTGPEQPMHLRLREIFLDIQQLIREFQPHEVAVEELFFGRNVTTAITVGQARGAALLAAAMADLPLTEYTPATIKQALTGYGNADKFQMQAMVRQLLDLDEAPHPDDAADGVAIALCHLQTGRFQALVADA
ncbi:MAG: crossover junction endodeoxyribonuclease RuvC [Caldilineaceae bacterium SB0668_bin_21]|nr:crossover junction endodeoxyribonuclease RuvC [Caldilineaceae bacterium SB0668_bin_21]MYC20870.1 crossover junction endodeoxyribonuclease RuvC [Caldilineaceae bacterium SB0662_bin_25]